MHFQQDKWFPLLSWILVHNSSLQRQCKFEAQLNPPLDMLVLQDTVSRMKWKHQQDSKSRWQQYRQQAEQCRQNSRSQLEYTSLQKVRQTALMPDSSYPDCTCMY